MSNSNQSSQPFSGLRAWLSPSDAPRNTDLIFVLAGRVARKEYALDLFRQGLAPRILFSVGRFEIRRFSKMPLPMPLDLLSIAQAIPPPQRHYFAYFHAQDVKVDHVPPGRFGTLTEIRALSRCLDAHPEIRSMVIVSSPAHLRRIRLCCRHLLRKGLSVAYVAAAESPNENSAPQSAADDLRELFKLIVYSVRLKLGR